MWNDQQDFLCARCARRQKTCCQGTEIHVTLGDVQRIADYSGAAEFFEFRAPQNPYYADQDDDPVWRDRVFQPDGTRRVLKHRTDGDCTFLGEQGCTLPLQVRPLVCRLYPFDYTADGLAATLAEGCPVELLPPGQKLLVALDMYESDAVAWHRQLYNEIQQAEIPAEGGLACTSD